MVCGLFSVLGISNMWSVTVVINLPVLRKEHISVSRRFSWKGLFEWIFSSFSVADRKLLDFTFNPVVLLFFVFCSAEPHITAITLYKANRLKSPVFRPAPQKMALQKI